MVKWFYPGLGVKRWFMVVFAGLLVFMGGIFSFWAPGAYFKKKAGLVIEFLADCALHPAWSVLLLVLGILLFFWGLQKIGHAFGSILLPNNERDLAERLYSRRFLEKGPKIVVLGGGTGLSMLLRGLKQYTANLTAIVTVTDDGGSSGRLREEMGMLPPGDIRNCLLALADTEPLLEQLFQYRFNEHESLKGHSFGNLFIAAMTKLKGFNMAIQEFSKVLAIKGTVLPVTLEQVTLQAEFTDGSSARGETNIVSLRKRIKFVSLVPADCKPLPEVLKAIKSADAVILGPGSLYTSVLPNLLLPGIIRAVKESKALCLYVCNIMTQPGETEGYSASTHLDVLQKHGCAGIIDAVIINNANHFPAELLEKYKSEGAQVVEIDRRALAQRNMKLIEAPLLEHGGLARHDSKKLAALILNTLLEWEAGLEGFRAFPFIRLNANYRRAKKEMGDLGAGNFCSKRPLRFLSNAFRRF